MKFTEFTLPESVPKDGLSPAIRRALRIYSQIDPSGHYDLSEMGDQNELLDMFEERHAYIAIDDDRIVQGVANYYPDTGKDYGWIEGLATNRGARIGSFMVENLVTIANKQGRSALELQSVQSALGFWVKQGFDIMSEDPRRHLIRMRRDLN